MRRPRLIIGLLAVVLALACGLGLGAWAISPRGRTAVIARLMVGEASAVEPDLIAVLGGGYFDEEVNGVRCLREGRSTEERLRRTIALHRSYAEAPILLCACRDFEGPMTDFLEAKGGIPRELVRGGTHRFDAENGGTINNALEIVQALDSAPDGANLVVVTSPYHELRTDRMLRAFLARYDRRDVAVSFAHIEDSEIHGASTRRFVRLVAHEVLGIPWFEWQMLTKAWSAELLEEGAVHEIPPCIPPDDPNEPLRRCG